MLTLQLLNRSNIWLHHLAVSAGGFHVTGSRSLCNFAMTHLTRRSALLGWRSVTKKSESFRLHSLSRKIGKTMAGWKCRECAQVEFGQSLAGNLTIKKRCIGLAHSTNLIEVGLGMQSSVLALRLQSDPFRSQEESSDTNPARSPYPRTRGIYGGNFVLGNCRLSEAAQ